MAHPDVVSTTHKELHFFDEFWRREFTADDVRRYHQYFQRPAGAIAGEWTPGYALMPWVPPLLAQAAPEAAIVVIARDPIDRFVSLVSHSAFHGAPLNPLMLNRHLADAMTAAHMENLYRWFPQERVLFLQFERCVASTTGELRRTFAHIGVDPDRYDYRSDQLAGRRNRLRRDKVPLSQNAMRNIQLWLDSDARRLSSIADDFDASLWSRRR